MAMRPEAASIERRAFLGAMLGATSAFIVRSIGRPLAVGKTAKIGWFVIG
jgi:hypothetical protein